MLYLLIGTYTMGASEGLYVYQLNTMTGEAAYVSMAKVDNPSYLVSTPDNRFIYAVTENNGNPSYANAFSFDPESGQLTFINRSETAGASPCNMTVDTAGNHVVTANYGGGSISVFDTNTEGALSPVKQVITFSGQGTEKGRQNAPHLHCVKFSPDGKYLFATDLGTDHIYRFETTHSEKEPFIKEDSRTSFKVTDGSGPRHIEFHPSGKYLYLINELAGTVTGFLYNNGNLKEIQTIVADTLNAKGSGDIAITPDGQFVYASNRLKGDGVAIFALNQKDGKLAKTGYQPTGVHPRNMVITPNGKFLLVANKDSHNIQLFAINPENGALTDIQKDILLDSPVCLKFLSIQE
ncbi:lactonase family protein [Parabacteroides sp. PF5-9]|uniref:lactonase family protein n=1 Tax=Parabacteroides sp. PF5-9 TaxID=1742404 RepID=UPI002476CBE4|nr:lactonase family protein [Parabacteroides sp. PF5-9]MDH6356705.1 6-phosphogluconolactonase [Parabacteroides sp. PF5-9]